MGEYYLWESVRESQSNAVADDGVLIGQYVDDILNGKPLNDFPNDFELYLEEQGSLTGDLLIVGKNAVLFSPKLLELLIAQGVDSISYYPCQIKTDMRDEKSYPYYLIVIRDIIYCLDILNSDLLFDYDNLNSIDQVMSVCIDEGKLDKKNDKLFKLGEEKDCVIVHESIKEIIESAGVSGMRFTPADGTYPIVDPEEQSEWWLYEIQEYDYSYMLDDDGAECLNENFPIQKYAYVKRDE